MEIDYMAGLGASYLLVVLVLKIIVDFYLTAVVKNGRKTEIWGALEKKLLQQKALTVFEDNKTFAVPVPDNAAVLGVTPEILSQKELNFCANTKIVRSIKLSNDETNPKGIAKKELWIYKDSKGKFHSPATGGLESKWEHNDALALGPKVTGIYLRPIFSSKCKNLILSGAQSKSGTTCNWEFADGTNRPQLNNGAKDWNELDFNDNANVLKFTRNNLYNLLRLGNQIKKIYVVLIK